MPDQPEVLGLLSLVLHCEARRAARRSPDGRFIPLSEQDPRLWRLPMIGEAERHLAYAARLRRPGRFQIEAAIHSVHAERARTGVTDWKAIALFYERLVELSPVLGALVARAAAVAEVTSADSALRLLNQIDGSASKHLSAVLGRTRACAQEDALLPRGGGCVRPSPSAHRRCRGSAPAAGQPGRNQRAVENGERRR